MQIEIDESYSMKLALGLTRLNMLPYYQKRGIVWDQSMYEKNWSHQENYDVKYIGTWVGILRISTDENALYIRDLQIDPNYQNLGIGTSCLSYAVGLATSRTLSRLRLLVFCENPALYLYKKFGFQNVGESNGMVKMEMFVEMPSS